MMSSDGHLKRNEFNILLLGETGAGKSLLINAFANYVAYESLKEAEDEGVKCLIPTKFSISDDDYEEYLISVGSDDNECMDMAKSGTLACKSYVFLIDNCQLRLIDSAGIAATQGPQVDAKNIEDVLEFISHFDDLHAIAIVMNSNQARITSQFDYCFSKLMSNLDKSAIDNIVFLFTNSENSGYKPGSVREPLQSCLDKLKPRQLKLSKKTMYCFENKWFRYLLAARDEVRFNEEDRLSYVQSWSRSFEEYGRLLRYVIGGVDHDGLTPHKVKGSPTNEARLFAIKLRPILQEILLNIEINTVQISAKLEQRRQYDEEIGQLQMMTSTPFYDVEIVRLAQAQVVSGKCRKVVTMPEEVQWQRPSVCCDGCKVLIGRRLFCQAIDLVSGVCRSCGCHSQEHQRILIGAKQVVSQRENPQVVKYMKDVTLSREQHEAEVKSLLDRQSELETEKKLITAAIAKFVGFIDQNAIGPKEVESMAGASGVMGDVVSRDEVLQYKKLLLHLHLYGEKIENAMRALDETELTELMQHREMMVAQVKSTAVRGLQWITTHLGF